MLQRVEAVDEFLAIETSHFHILNLVEGRIEQTEIIVHLQEIIDIDDIALAHLYKALVECEQILIVRIAFQSERLLFAGNHHLPDALVVVVLEEADILQMHESEV